MKKPKLVLARETLRTLGKVHLEAAAGGASGGTCLAGTHGVATCGQIAQCTPTNPCPM
jgi:hypothetical protein